MDTYVAIIEEILADFGLTTIQLALGIVAFCLLTTLLVILGSGRKAAKLAATLANVRAGHDSTLAQLTENAQNAQAHIQQLEGQLQLKDADIAQQKQAAQSEADRAQTLQQQIDQRSQALRQLLVALEQDFPPQSAEAADINTLDETALWQRHDGVIADLTNRLHADGQQLAKLQAKVHSYKAHTDKLEVARMQVFNDLNLAAQKIRHLETDLNAKLLEEQSKAEQASAKLHAYKADIDKLELERMQVFNDLNLATQKIRGLETELSNQGQEAQNNQQALAGLQAQNQAYKTDLDKLEQTRVQAANDLNLARQKIGELEAALKAKSKENPVAVTKPVASQAEETVTAAIAEEEDKKSNPLFAKVINSLGLGRQQPSEDDKAETKEAPLEDKPAVIIEAVEDTKKPNPLFPKLMGSLGLGKQASVKDDGAEAQQAVTEQQPANQQEETAENAKPIGQLKSFYQKLTASKKN